MQEMTGLRALLGVLAVIVLVASAAGCGIVSDQTKQEAKKKLEATVKQAKQDVKQKVEAKKQQAKKKAEAKGQQVKQQVKKKVETGQEDLQKKVDDLKEKVETGQEDLKKNQATGFRPFTHPPTTVPLPEPKTSAGGRFSA